MKKLYYNFSFVDGADLWRYNCFTSYQGGFCMKKFMEDMHTLSNLVHEFKYELEDNPYESPALAKKLADYRSRVKAVLTYKPVFLEEESIDEQLSIFALAKDDAKNVLAELKAINSKSNIFDIIDVLDKVGAFALKYLPFD